VRAGDGLQPGGDVPKLSLGQPAGEVLADASEMRPGGSPNDLASLIGQPGEHDSSVSLETIPSDQAASHESVHHSSEPAWRHHHAFGQLGHPQRTIRSPSEAKQHVVGAEVEPVFRAELGVEVPDHLIVGMKERLPGSKLRVA
jgi:hypothetical protein